MENFKRVINIIKDKDTITRSFLMINVPCGFVKAGLILDELLSKKIVSKIDDRKYLVDKEMLNNSL